LKPLEIAIGDYDQVRDLAAGRALVEGFPVKWITQGAPEGMFGKLLAGEWDGGEFSLAAHAGRISRGLDDLVGIPVFPARSFRHSAIYVRAGAGLREPSDLVGRRVGAPVWAQTAGVWVRGFLGRDYGVPPDSVEWHLAGVDEPGREEPVEISPPASISIERHPTGSLDEMLRQGLLDAVVSARPPRCVIDGSGVAVPLFDDPTAVESEWFRRSGVFPIMHVLVVRRTRLAESQGLAGALVEACEEAKRHSLRRLADATIPHAPLPWVALQLAQARRLLGEDPWPYGLEANREALAWFLELAFDQGVCARKLRPEDLFWPATA
jgi:4,5-dihydroxyphthalate decarboxylase